LYMTSIDPDGPGTNYYVQSQIIRSDALGHVTAVSPPLRSNASANNYSQLDITHTYDFYRYYYYVRVDLYRADVNALPIFVGVGVYTL
jgi:hypothetical protein